MVYLDGVLYVSYNTVRSHFGKQGPSSDGCQLKISTLVNFDFGLYSDGHSQQHGEICVGKRTFSSFGWNLLDSICLMLKRRNVGAELVTPNVANGWVNDALV